MVSDKLSDPTATLSIIHKSVFNKSFVKVIGLL